MADKANDDFNLGVGLFRSQRFELAADTFEKFVTEFPDHPRTNLGRLYLGLTLNSLEQYARAREQFELFLKTEPDGKNAAEARYRLGECSYFLRDYPAAINQLTAYLEQHPEHSQADWAKLLVGKSYLASEQWGEGEAILSSLVNSESTIPPVRPDASISLGSALEALKKTPEALDHYNAIVSGKDPEIAPRALLRIANIQFSSQQYKESAATYDVLLATYPASNLAAAANFGAGKALYESKDFEAALKRFRLVSKTSPDAAKAILMTAVSLRELGRVEESRTEFSEALKAAGDSNLAAEILFQQATLDARGEDRKLAAQTFEDIADRWPKSERTADCLLNASELHLQLNDQDRAERLFNRLNTEFPEAVKQPQQQILLGRLYLADNALDKAITTLSKCAEAITDPNDRNAVVGRYFLVRALFESKRHDEVVQQALIMQDGLEPNDLDEMRGALALAAISSLELKEYDNVLKFADKFLPRATDANKRADIIGTRAVALSHLNRFPEAIESLTALASTNADQPQTWTAILQAAETALELKAADHAEALFSLATLAPKDSKAREAGVSGMAWSQFKAQKYPLAAKSFSTFVTEFPNSKEVAQAVFMQARCVEEQGDAEQTLAAFESVFDKLTAGVTEVPADAESMPPFQYAYDAGKQMARSLTKLNRPADADLAWKKLTTLFANAKDLDARLDEWAWMHATAGDFAKSDAIHKRLLENFPDSPFAGQARLSLAESLLESGKIPSALDEMKAIVADLRYGATEKERALFHIVEIQTTLSDWQAALVAARTFLADFAASPLAPQVRQFSGNALLQQGKPDEAIEVLSLLREDIISGKVTKEAWVDRVWVVLADAALAKQDYEQIDALETELKDRSPESLFAFQMHDVQGRRWKQQAPPDFAKARQYFQMVTGDPQARGTETSARCQFLMGETYVMESDPGAAAKEYFKVYLNYHGHDELRAQALFQGASCQVRLNRTDLAIRDFKELIEKFPTSKLVPDAMAELKKLEAVGP